MPKKRNREKKEKNWKREGLNEEIETSEWKKNGCEKGVTTGCSFSDQHIFSPKYNNLFFFSDCPEIQNTSFVGFEFQNNLWKSLYIWQNQSSYFGLIDEKICWSEKE